MPWDRGDLVAMLYRDAEVLSTAADPRARACDANVGLRELAALREFVPRERPERVLALRRPDRPERRIGPRDP